MEKPLTISEQITATQALIADLEMRRQAARPPMISSLYTYRSQHG
jgi:hypothetical protein